MNQESLVHTIQSWYPFTAQYQQKELESCQKLALQIIYPGVGDNHGRLAAAILPPLNEALKTMCHALVRMVKDSCDHPLIATAE